MKPTCSLELASLILLATALAGFPQLAHSQWTVHELPDTTPYMVPGELVVTSGDFNGDGLTDYACADYGATVIVRINTGDGFDYFSWNHVADYDMTELDAGDINGDGKDELVYGNNRWEYLSDLYVRTFTPGQGWSYEIIDSYFPYYDIQLAYVPEIGKEVIICLADGNLFTLIPPSFSRFYLISPPDNPYIRSFYALDHDGNGCVDLHYKIDDFDPPDAFPDNVLMRSADIDTTFALIFVDEEAGKLIPVDVDNDLDTDYISAFELEPDLTQFCWYENDGEHTLTQRNLPVQEGDCVFQYVGDLVNGPYPEFIYIDYSMQSPELGFMAADTSDNIPWYVNYTIGNSVDKVWGCGDMDGDSDNDLLVAQRNEYSWSLEWLENPGELAVTEQRSVELPARFSISNVYPNPFNNSCLVDFSISQPATINMSLSDITGRRVWERALGVLAVGQHNVAVDASHLTSGVYILTIQQTLGAGTSRRITLIR